MREALVEYVGMVTFVLSILFSPNFVQMANAQNEDQLFKDCRSKVLELSNKMSEAMDRLPFEDVRTEVHSIVTEALVLASDCKPVEDRLSQDPAVQYQNEYFMERAKEFR